MTDDPSLTGIPQCLRPVPTAADRFAVVTSGPRNLESAPFDYRNPFPLRPADSIARMPNNGACTRPRRWPLDDDRVDGFNYYLNANAAVGSPGGPECALVDGFGTLRAFAGGFAFAHPSAAPLDLRLRTAPNPRVPLVAASTTLDACRLDFSWFMAVPADAPECRYPMTGCLSYPWLDQDPAGPALLLVARCQIRNLSSSPQPIALVTAFSQRGELCTGAWYMNPRRWPELTGAALAPAVGGRHLLAAQAGPDRVLLGLLDPDGLALSDAPPIAHWPEQTLLAPDRTQPSWQRTLTGEVPPASCRTVIWIIPYYPAPRAHEAFLASLTHDGLLADCQAAWLARHAGRTSLRVPEQKVQDAFNQALTHLDLCSVAVGPVEYPTPGPTCGHHIFYFRDCPDMIYAYDLVGEKSRVRRMIAHYDRTEPSDESGYFLWLAGAHWDLCPDPAWLPRVLPTVEKHMAWLTDAWQKSRAANDGLLPEVAIGDNELCRGHYVSYHLYALAGARAAGTLALAAGRTDLAQPWQEFARDFGGEVLRHVDALAARTGGVLTPTFEGFDAEGTRGVPVEGGEPRPRSGSYGPGGGCDWHNLAAVFPTGILPADHPVVESSLRRWRHAYVEGIFPYPLDSDSAVLHTYNTMNLSGTWLRRGDWAEALRDLYGLLLHTSATHAAGEVVATNLRWDFQCSPHNWFSGKFVRFLRDCLAHERPDARLHLLSGLSPAWMTPGAAVELNAAPTTLGPITLRASMLDAGLDLSLDFRPRPHAAGLVLHLPPFLSDVRVWTPAGPCAPSGAGWLVPSWARLVHARWRPAPLPDISFRAIAAAYIADYRNRSETASGSR